MKIDKGNLCIVTMPYWHHTLQYGFESAAACGFRNIEFWAASPQYCYTDYTPDERKARKREILATMNALELSMPVFSPEQMDMYPLNIASPDPAIQNDSIGRILEYLDDAVEFGAGAMTLGTGWQYMDEPKEENYLRSVAAVKEIAERAEMLKLKLFIAPMGRTSGTFVWDLTTLERFLRAVDKPNVKACVNLADITENTGWMDASRDFVGHVRFSDLGGKALGNCGTDLPGALRRLEVSGYDGLLSLNITFRDCCIQPDRAVFSSAKWLKANGFLD